MPRRTRSEVIDSIRTFSAEGLNQTEIAKRLGMHQPHVSKIMRANNIVKGSNIVHIARGSTVYQTSEGEIAFHVTVTRNGETFKGYANVSPTQLEQLTEYARNLFVQQQPPGMRFVLGVVDAMIERDLGDR